ncbi:hypothetical protein BJX99DRAFT_157937 [Aspergillus californicus]
MFEGNFKETEEQLAELEEIDGVVSNRIFSLLLQWLYLGRFKFAEESPSDRITAMIELARFADMLKINGMDPQIVECIRTTVLDNPHQHNNPRGGSARTPDTHIHHMTPEHIDAASRLPKGHLVRLLPAKAAVHAYLHSDNFKFSKETQDVPEFAADLLEVLNVALKSFKYNYTTQGLKRRLGAAGQQCDELKCTYKDPFTEERRPFRE